MDETTDGKINVIDYKTGYARSVKEVEGGYAPQLPIEGLIAKFGGFQNIPATEVGRLIYWQLGRQETVIENNMNELLDKSYERIVTLASVFVLKKRPISASRILNRRRNIRIMNIWPGCASGR